MAKDRERIEQCLAVVDAYEASGQKASVWAQTHGVALRDLASWCCHARRWRARLNGQASPLAQRTAPTGFVAATMPAGAMATVQLQWPSASGALTLHWPISHLRELGTWLRELGTWLREVTR